LLAICSPTREITNFKCSLEISIARSRPKFKENCQIFIHGSSRVAKNILQIEGFKKNLLPYLTCSQIWLNLPVDDWPLCLHHKSGYIARLIKKNNIESQAHHPRISSRPLQNKTQRKKKKRKTPAQCTRFSLSCSLHIVLELQLVSLCGFFFNLLLSEAQKLSVAAGTHDM
jgi:hypothetical protein